MNNLLTNIKNSVRQAYSLRDAMNILEVKPTQLKDITLECTILAYNDSEGTYIVTNCYYNLFDGEFEYSGVVSFETKSLQTTKDYFENL